MASYRRRYQNNGDAEKDSGPPVASAPRGATASAPIVDEPKPAETPKVDDAPANPVKEAETASLKARLAEMERAETLSRQVQQPQDESPQQQEAGPQQQLTVEQIIADAPVPERAKTWLLTHQEYVTDPVKNHRLQKMHNVAEYQAGGEYTDLYFEKLETLLGLKQAPSNGGQRPVQPPAHRQSAPVRQSGPPVSAPPTREAPSMTTGRPPSDSQVHLTSDEIQVALASRHPGDTDRQAINRYAANKLKLQQQGQIGAGARDGR